MSLRPLLAWASDHHTFPLPEAHPFPLAKYSLVRERLVAERVLEPAWLSRSEPAPEAWLPRLPRELRSEPATGSAYEAKHLSRRLAMRGDNRTFW